VKSSDKKNNEWIPSLVLKKEVRLQKILLVKRKGHVPRFMPSRARKKDQRFKI